MISLLRALDRPPLENGEPIQSTTDLGGRSLGSEYSNSCASAPVSPGPSPSELSPRAAHRVLPCLQGTLPTFPLRHRKMVVADGIPEADVSAEQSFSGLVFPSPRTHSWIRWGTDEGRPAQGGDRPFCRGAGQMELRAQEAPTSKMAWVLPRNPSGGEPPAASSLVSGEQILGEIPAPRAPSARTCSSICPKTIQKRPAPSWDRPTRRGAGQIRTAEWRFCRPLPYHLATAPK
jgi:hypothetical protein